MRGLACVFLALACSCGEKPPPEKPRAPLPVPSASASASASSVAVDASAPIDAHVPRPSSYAPVAAVLMSPDSVEAFALSSHGFADVPPITPRFVANYPVAKKLAPPSASFVKAFAAIVLADDAYRREAVACALSDRHVGFRFTRGADVVEIAILAACPSVSGISTIETQHLGGQLEGELSDRLAALIRASYPSVFTR